MQGTLMKRGRIVAEVKAVVDDDVRITFLTRGPVALTSYELAIAGPTPLPIEIVSLVRDGHTQDGHPAPGFTRVVAIRR